MAKASTRPEQKIAQDLDTQNTKTKYAKIGRRIRRISRSSSICTDAEGQKDISTSESHRRHHRQHLDAERRTKTTTPEDIREINDMRCAAGGSGRRKQKDDAEEFARGHDQQHRGDFQRVLEGGTIRERHGRVRKKRLRPASAA